jgi:hypothetical protein
MSNGRVVEQGSHDELYSNDGMYRGLVDAQRISAESTGDGGDETLEETVAMEAVLRRSRSQSIPQGDLPPLFRRKSSRRSESFVETKDLESGVIEKTKYSLWYLLKKVHFMTTFLITGSHIQQGGIQYLIIWMGFDYRHRFILS